MWQPGAIQKAIVDRILRKVNETTPYEIRAESVSGDFINQISLHGVHLSAHGDATDLLRAQTLEIRVQWTGLLHHRLEIHRLKLVAPALFLTLNPEGALVWPRDRRRLRKIRSSRFTSIIWIFRRGA